MEEIMNLKCKEHPLETITNFCLNCTLSIISENCKVGLCSLCICHHTELHVQNSTSPIYKPLKIIYEGTMDRIKSYITALEQDKQRMINMMKNITNRKQSFKEILHEAKSDVLRVVDQLFEEMEVRFEEEVRQEKSKTGFHSMYQVQALCKKVNREIDTLVSECQTLNSHKFIDVVKNIEVNTLNEAKKLHFEVAQEIKLNEDFVPSLIYRKQLMAEVELCTRRLLSLTFLVPNQLNKVFKKTIEDEKQNTIRKVESCQKFKTNLSMGPKFILKQSMQLQDTNPKSSYIFENTSNHFPKQGIKSQVSRISITPRSSNCSKVIVQPQLLSSGTFSMIRDRKSMVSDLTLTGDRVFAQFSRNL